MDQQATMPRKTRDIRNHHMDSRIWNDFPFRDDDIVIATYAKSGTTWLQQIVGQLVFKGDPEVAVAALSPWLDLRIPPAPVKLAALAAQTHRRFIKTHLPVDALVWSPRAKYLYVARDGRDVVWSLYNHHARANAHWYAAINDTPDRVGPPIAPPPADIRQYFLDWLEGDGFPFWSFWENIRSWWAVRDQPNLKLLHFAKIKADMEREIRGIAAFLGIAVAPEAMAAVLEHCSFDYMRDHGDKTVPLGGAAWEGGARTFVHKGVNGRWRDTLTAADNALYEERARHELGEACAHWLATGEG